MRFFLPTSIIGRVIAVVLIVLSVYGGFRWWLSSHDAALVEGYVLKQERDALQSLLDEKERQRIAATQSLEEYRKRAVADALIQQKLEAQLEQAIKDDNQNMDDGDYRWGDADRLWLCKQRGAADCGR